LALSLDSPEQIATDFGIPDESIAKRRSPDSVVANARSRKAAARSESIRSLPGDHPRFVGVVGESHYQDPLRTMLGSGKSIRVTVEGEPANAHDKNAVRIANDAGETIGYLAKGQYTLLKKIARVAPVTCSAELRGGTPDKPSIGIVLDLGDSFAPDPNADKDQAR
jgi:hypothetical protein